MVSDENFLRLTVTVRFQKTSTSKACMFLLFFSVSYNNVVVTKQIYYSLTFLKSWVHICDNVAGVVGGPQYYQMGYKYKEGEGDLFHCPVII